MVFDDVEQKVYIHWNGLIKATTVRYLEFARLFVEETSDSKNGIIYIATTSTHYRFNKYLSKIEIARQYVAQVNNWWNVERVEEKKRKYNNMAVISKHNKAKREQKKEAERVKTEEEIHLENEEELGKLIKKLKYKSFDEKDIEMACKLKEFFESKFRAKMVEEYENIKKDLENIKKEESNDGSAFIFKNEGKYIASALLLKFETLEKLMEERKMNQLQMMINENKRNKIRFDDDSDSAQKQNDEEKFDTIEDEEEANGGF